MPNNTEPVWLLSSVITALHETQISEHGGISGVRDQGLLESALARPKNLIGYEPSASLFALAAAYSAGLVYNHPLVDGNKRVAFLAAYVFLARNGLTLEADEAEAVRIVNGLASGDIPEAAFADWLQANCVKS